MSKVLTQSLTDIPGFRVGHAQDTDALTGVTVVLCESGAVAGVDQRGGAPGTRETDAIRPMHLVDRAHAVILAGGSAFGLDAAGGVMRYLAERNVGFDAGVARVPIVPAAVIFDLAIGRADAHPDAEMGYQACLNATSGPTEVGNIGVGSGATVGKVLGMGQSMKSGVGSASMEIGGGIRVAALIAVNSFGDVLDPESREIISGARSFERGPVHIGAGAYFADTIEVMKTLAGRVSLNFASHSNTVIGVVGTNAKLNKEEVNKVAQMAQDGLALTIRPAHTMLDGDTIFALATGNHRADVNIIGAFAAEVVSRAIVRAVLSAQPAGGLPSAQQKL